MEGVTLIANTWSARLISAPICSRYCTVRVLLFAAAQKRIDCCAYDYGLLGISVLCSLCLYQRLESVGSEQYHIGCSSLL